MRPKNPIVKINVIDNNRELIEILPIAKFCTSCKQLKGVQEFSRNDKRLELNLRCYCKQCNYDRQDKWRKTNPKKQKEYKLFARFGITYKDYEDMLIAQNYRCKICDTHIGNTARKVLCVDHCHKTDRIRGLLCDNCNKGLGHFYDKPELLVKSIEYLGYGINKNAI